MGIKATRTVIDKPNYTPSDAKLHIRIGAAAAIREVVSICNLESDELITVEQAVRDHMVLSADQLTEQVLRELGASNPFKNAVDEPLRDSLKKLAVGKLMGQLTELVSKKKYQEEESERRMKAQREELKELEVLAEYEKAGLEYNSW